MHNRFPFPLGKGDAPVGRCLVSRRLLCVEGTGIVTASLSARQNWQTKRTVGDACPYNSRHALPLGIASLVQREVDCVARRKDCYKASCSAEQKGERRRDTRPRPTGASPLPSGKGNQLCIMHYAFCIPHLRLCRAEREAALSPAIAGALPEGEPYLCPLIADYGDSFTICTVKCANSFHICVTS